MICYQCGQAIPDEEPFYNDHEKYVCKPCFNESRRCFVCRFPGRDLQPVEGLGPECEFCRGQVVAEDTDVASVLQPVAAYLGAFGHKVPEAPRFERLGARALREMQTDADVAPEAFIDDFLRSAYPVFYRDGTFHLLKRMAPATFTVNMIVQAAVADIAGRFGLPDLSGRTPFHTFARGWCHWLGYEAAGRLGYDLERRRLRKWPELGLQGEFETFERMGRIHKPAKVLAHVKASLGPLAKKHLSG